MRSSRMRPFVAIVVIVVGLVVAPTGAPGATVPSAAGPGPTSTGTFDLLYEDPVDRAGAPVVEPGPRAVVDTPDGPLTLPAVPVDARPGDRVRVDHRSGVVEVVSAVAEAPVTGTEDVLVVPVQWSGNGSDGTTAASLSNVMADSRTWLDEVSDGRLDLRATVRGWTTITRPSGSCDEAGYSFAYDVRTRTHDALRAAGVEPGAYDVVVIYFARTSSQTACAWAGLGGGSAVWLAAYASLGVIVHELGHTFGLGHASRLACTSGGEAVSLSGTCSAIEYGDPTDIMGASDAGFAGPHLESLGWLATAERRALSVPSTGTTSTSALLRPLSRPGTGVRLVRISHPDGSTYWVENRQRVGIDATNLPAAHVGVVVHFTPADGVTIPCQGQISGCAGSSFVIDARPADGVPESVAVDPVTGWSSPDGAVRIDVTATAGQDVTVAVQLSAPSAAPPTVTAVETGREGTVVRWSGGDTGATGDAPTGYRAYVVEYPYWLTVDAPLGARSAVLPTPSYGLGEKVTIRVAAINAMGPGVPSAPTRPRHLGGQAPYPTWDDMVATLRGTFKGTPGSWNARYEDVNALDSGAITPANYVATLVTDPHYEPRVAPVARLYRAYFRRLPDHAGLRYWADQLRAGRSLGWVSQAFSRSPEFVNTYGSLTDRQFVDLVYRNVLGRAPETAGWNYWTGVLTSGHRNRGQVMIGFSQSPENVRATAPIVDAVMLYAGLLDRKPTTAEVDAAASLTRAHLARQILLSRELEDRVG